MEKQPQSSTRAPEVVAVFDFDGTLTTHDTMFRFCRFVSGRTRFWVTLMSLLPMLIAFRLGLISNTQAKEAFLTAFLKGKSLEELHNAGRAFGGEIIPSLIRPGGLSAINHHREQGHQLVIVTASMACWVKAWAEDMGILLLASQGAFRGGVFTGQLQGPNCHGPEKVKRLKAWMKQQGTTPARIIAYGDSEGDRELLALADEAHFRPWR